MDIDNMEVSTNSNFQRIVDLRQRTSHLETRSETFHEALESLNEENKRLFKFFNELQEAVSKLEGKKGRENSAYWKWHDKTNGPLYDIDGWNAALDAAARMSDPGTGTVIIGQLLDLKEVKP